VRERKCANGRKEGKTVMNYGENRNEWTECSNQDFKVFYNKVLLKKDFCLQDLNKTIGEYKPSSI